MQLPSPIDKASDFDTEEVINLVYCFSFGSKTSFLLI